MVGVIAGGANTGYRGMKSTCLDNGLRSGVEAVETMWPALPIGTTACEPTRTFVYVCWRYVASSEQRRTIDSELLGMVAV